jgi:hypothetical protein
MKFATKITDQPQTVLDNYTRATHYMISVCDELPHLK